MGVIIVSGMLVIGMIISIAYMVINAEFNDIRVRRLLNSMRYDIWDLIDEMKIIIHDNPENGTIDSDEVSAIQTFCIKFGGIDSYITKSKYMKLLKYASRSTEIATDYLADNDYGSESVYHVDVLTSNIFTTLVNLNKLE